LGRAREFPDEEKLMGSSSYGVGLGDWIVRQSTHWIYKNTGLKDGDTIPGLVGWEYHGPPLKDDPGLVVLAESEFKNSDNPNPFAATLYNGPKENFVFNAATCWWSMPLSSPPGFRNPPNKDFSKDDPRVQQITKNLISRVLSSPGPSK
jgi:hypothetical protein